MWINIYGRIRAYKVTGTLYIVQSLYLHTVLCLVLHVYLYAVPFVVIVGEVEQLQGEGGPQASHQLSVQSTHSHLHYSLKGHQHKNPCHNFNAIPPIQEQVQSLLLLVHTFKLFYLNSCVNSSTHYYIYIFIDSRNSLEFFNNFFTIIMQR